MSTKGGEISVGGEPRSGRRPRSSKEGAPPAESVAKERGRRTTLVAHSDRAQRLLLSSALSLDGRQVVSLGDGVEVLELLADWVLAGQAPDILELIVIETTLPGRAGLDLLADLRQQGWRTPLVLVSPAGVPARGARVPKLGGAVLLNEPVTPEELLAVVKVLLTSDLLASRGQHDRDQTPGEERWGGAVLPSGGGDPSAVHGDHLAFANHWEVLAETERIRRLQQGGTPADGHPSGAHWEVMLDAEKRGDPGLERRSATRVPVEMAVTELVGPKRVEQRCSNLSAGGLLLESTAEPVRGSILPRRFSPRWERHDRRRRSRRSPRRRAPWRRSRDQVPQARQPRQAHHRGLRGACLQRQVKATAGAQARRTVPARSTARPSAAFPP